MESGEGREVNTAKITGFKYFLGYFCLLAAVIFAMNLIFKHQESTGHVLAVSSVTAAVIYVVRRTNFFD